MKKFAPLLVATPLSFVPGLRGQTILVSDYGNGDGAIKAYFLNGAPNLTLIRGLIANAGIAVSSTGDMYVASQQSSGSGYVGQYTSDGTPVNTHLVTGLNGSVAVALDESNNLYIANFDSNTVSKYSSGGVLTSNFIATGLSGPSGIAFDSAGNIYVTNYNAGTMGKYASDGSTINATFLTGLSNPFGIAISSGNDIFVANSTANNVWKFDSSGEFVTAFNDGMSRPTALSIFGTTIYVDNQSPESQSIGSYVGSYALDGSTINSVLFGGLTNSFGMTVTAIPEPASYAALVGLSAFGLIAIRRRAKRDRGLAGQ